MGGIGTQRSAAMTVSMPLTLNSLVTIAKMPNPRIYIARGKGGAWSTRCRSIVLVSLISVAPLDWPGKAPGRRFRLQEQCGVQKTARRHRRAHGNFSLRTR